jgi:hypothetical protein
MLAALARQMDVDVLISGGTHRYVSLALIYMRKANLRLDSKRLSLNRDFSSTQVRRPAHGVHYGMGMSSTVLTLITHKPARLYTRSLLRLSAILQIWSDAHCYAEYQFRLSESRGAFAHNRHSHPCPGYIFTQRAIR